MDVDIVIKYASHIDYLALIGRLLSTYDNMGLHREPEAARQLSGMDKQTVVSCYTVGAT